MCSKNKNQREQIILARFRAQHLGVGLDPIAAAVLSGCMLEAVHAAVVP